MAKQIGHRDHTYRWIINGGRIEAGNAGTSKATVIATVGTVNKQTCEDTANARLICQAPVMRDLIEEATHRFRDENHWGSWQMRVRDVLHEIANG